MNIINHEQRAHARLSASRIHRVLQCPGSLLAEDALPPEPSGEAALRGTVIHELSEHLLLGTEMPEDADPELVKVAQAYVKSIDDFTQGIKKRYIELSVTDALREVHPSLGGTADYVGTGGGELLVADLKTGRIDVDPTWNPQLMTYALGAALTLRAPRDIGVRLAIYQPDSGGWKQWVCTYEDLMDWRDKLADVATEALKPEALRSPSESACRYCRARSICPTLRSTAITVAKQEFTTVDDQMVADAKLCQVFADSVLEKAVQQLKDAPTSIPGWKLRDGRKMLKWKDSKMAEVLLENNKEAWELKSASAIQKLGLELPTGIIEETRAAPSLVKAKE